MTQKKEIEILCSKIIIDYDEGFTSRGYFHCQTAGYNIHKP